MLVRLDRLHGDVRRRTQRQARRDLRRAWVLADGFGEDRFIEEADAIARASIGSIVSEYDAYLALSLTASGASASPVGLDPSDYMRPVNPEAQWRRPFVHMRTKLEQGMALPQALNFSGAQALSMLDTDMQAAGRDAAFDWMGNDTRVAAYARVLGSGGASGENCGLCVVASTQRYWVRDLMPIHDHCTCEVKPLTESQAGDRIISHKNLDAVHDRLAEIDGQYASRNDLGRVRINAGELPRPGVASHSEVGPYLYDSRGKAPSVRSASRAREAVVVDSARQRRIAAADRFVQNAPVPEQPGWALLRRSSD